MSAQIITYHIPLGATFHASPQSDRYGKATIIAGGSGSAVHVEYADGRRGTLSLLPPHKGAIPAKLLAAWRVEDGSASC